MNQKQYKIDNFYIDIISFNNKIESFNFFDSLYVYAKLYLESYMEASNEIDIEKKKIKINDYTIYLKFFINIKKYLLNIYNYNEYLIKCVMIHAQKCKTYFTLEENLIHQGIYDIMKQI